MFITSQNSLSCFIFIVLKKTNKDKQTNETWQCAFRDSPALPFPLLPGPTLYFIVFSMSFRFWFRFRQFLPGMGPRQLRAHWCGTGPAPLDGPQRLPPPPNTGRRFLVLPAALGLEPLLSYRYLLTIWEVSCSHGFPLFSFLSHMNVDNMPVSWLQVMCLQPQII